MPNTHVTLLDGSAVKLTATAHQSAPDISANPTGRGA
jgi:hypothetical protein